MMWSGGLAIIQYYIGLGQVHFLLLFITCLLLYFQIKSLVLLGRLVFWPSAQAAADMKALLLGMLILIGAVLMFAIVAGLGMSFVTTNPTAWEKVPFHNEWFKQADISLFGTFPALWFHSNLNPYKGVFDMLAPLLIRIYGSLSMLIGVIMFLSLWRSQKIFWHFMGAFFISLIISLPFWYFLPAVSPADAYIAPLSNLPPVLPDAYLATYTPNPSTRSFVQYTSQLAADLGNQFLPITSFPSMHVAWATMITFFGWQIYRWLGVALIPYFLLNAVSAVYTLQHYAVDLLAGTAVALLALLLAAFLLRALPRLPITFSLDALLQKDVVWVVDWSKTLQLKLLKYDRG